MLHFHRKRDKQSDGDRARALAYFLVGVCSAFLGFLSVLQLNRASLFDGFSLYEWWIVVASGLGGMVALFLSGDRLGQPGFQGLGRAVAGGIWVTFIGALIGGTLSLPLYGTMFGPFIVTVTLIGAPVLCGIWVFNLFSAHVLLGIYQRERDTIFAPEIFAPEEVAPVHLRPELYARRRIG